MKCSHTSATVSGQSHVSNQDAFVVDEALGAYLVCDGIGGHRGGDIAAQTACAAALEHLQKNSAIIEAAKVAGSSIEPLSELCTAAVLAANERVYRRSKADQTVSGMGTTIAMLVIAGGRGVVAHAGSSRVYVCRNGELIQLTKDHKLAQELIDRGLLTEQKAASLPYARALSKAVGLLEAITPDCLSLDALPGDRFLIVTDGVTQALPKDELRQIVAGPGGGSSASTIIKTAADRGGSDDATAIVVVPAAEPQESAEQLARSEQVVLKTELLQEMFLFKPLASSDIMEIVGQSELVPSKTGDVLFAQGSVEQNIYIILEGTFNVVVDGTVVAKLAKGSHFGEMSWLSHEARSATVRCAVDGTLLKVSALFLQSFILKSPECGVRILRELARELSSRLRATNALALVRAN